MIILSISLTLNALFFVVILCAIFGPPPFIKKPAPLAERNMPEPCAGHPAYAAQAQAKSEPAGCRTSGGERASVLETVQSVKAQAGLRLKVLSLIPIGEKNKVPFTELCRVFRERLEWTNQQTSKVLIYLRADARLIQTDGRNYWK